MNFFRRWHAQHEFRHHFGYGQTGAHGRHFGRHAEAGDVADHLAARLSLKLDLDADQRRCLSAFLTLLEDQRDALTGEALRSDLLGLMADEQFRRDTALQWLNAKLEMLRVSAPSAVNAYADFFDALDSEQRQALRFMMRRFGGKHSNGEAA